MRAIEVEIGSRWGSLVVLEVIPGKGSGGRGGRRRLKCQCDCGKVCTPLGFSVTSGDVSSCGCKNLESFKKRVTKHGRSRTRLYRAWTDMIQRCTNPKNRYYHRYGGRGIRVCERWSISFEAFAVDMGERPAGMTLERIDNDRNYQPGNCRWATKMEQAQNTARNVMVEAFELSLTLSEWSRRSGIGQDTISDRIRRGLSPEDALTLPDRKGNCYKRGVPSKGS